MLGSARSGDAGLGCMGSGVVRSGGAGSDGWRGWGGRARGVDRLGVRGSVGPLGPGDGSLVHHPR
jgi:hypothetical protein